MDQGSVCFGRSVKLLYNTINTQEKEGKRSCDFVMDVNLEGNGW